MQGRKYIFIVGCYNSGTTLLAHVLNRHEEISGLETEGVALTDQIRTPEQFGWNRLWYKCRDKLEVCRLAEKPDPEKVERDWAKYFDAAKPFWLEKSIIHSLNIDWIEQAFNAPHFIWLIRNGYAVAEGIRRRTVHKYKKGHPPGQAYPIEWCAKQWVEANRVIESKLARVRNCTFIAYEDLVEQFDTTINHVLNWLPVSKTFIRKPRTFTFHKEKMTIRNMNREAISRLSLEEIRKINEVASDDLRKWTYPVL